jgi:RimJ/RimL family protein N-acetyltransferase
MGPTLETARLILRPPREEDLDGWAELMGDPESARFIGGQQERSAAWRGMATMAGSWSLKGFGMFSVIDKASGEWLGRVGPWQPEGWPGTEVGWGLLRRAWGHGYARESAEAAIDWAFDALGWDEVIHIIALDNVGSQALAKRLGATNAGPTRMPPPFEAIEVELWRQSRERWLRRPKGASRRLGP